MKRNTMKHKAAHEPTRSRASGFVLAASLMIILLLGSLLALLHLLVNLQWHNVLDVESQLHSRVLAENGLEHARAMLPLLDLDTLLQGADGSWCGSGPQWRNPLPVEQARRIDPASFQPSCDDGLPHLRGSALPAGRVDDAGAFWVRFSNNPQEDSQTDRDRVVLVRSLGIVPRPIAHPAFPSARNSVCLLEARFRQETSFLLRQPLTVFADTGLFVWQGDDFKVQGGDAAAFGGSSLQGTRLFEDLMHSLTASQALRLSGAGPSPSMRDIRLDWAADPPRQRLFSARFWESLVRNLPRFDQGLQGRLAYLENPGSLVVNFQGILFAKGEMQLSGASSIEGLLVHLGEGRLTLRDSSRVQGGVWLSNLRVYSEGTGIRAGPISFRMANRSSIVYDEEAVRAALAALPPTQLGWRIIFPETNP